MKRRFGRQSKVRLRYEDGIVGTVTSPAFRGVDEFDRIQMIWAALEGQLTLQEERDITIIVPVAPEEDDESE